MPGKSTIKHKVCRALGVNLIGTPSAALTLSRRPNRPGQHGGGRQAKISPFGRQEYCGNPVKVKSYFRKNLYYLRLTMIIFSERMIRSLPCSY